jgi:polyisoprenoid-binding protein YceI
MPALPTALRSIAFAGFTIISAIASPKTFDLKDPKGVNAIQFKLDSILEPIAGTVGGITGTVTFDPAAVEATSGKVSAAASSIVVPNAKMNEHLLGASWVDAATHPEVSFAFTALTGVKPAGANKWTATATGQFSLKGVTKEITVPVSLTHLEGQLGTRLNKPELGGDLLVVRGEFSIARGDYGIKPGENEDKVAPVIQLTFALVGGAPKS